MLALHDAVFILALSFSATDWLALLPLLALGGLVYVLAVVGFLLHRLTHPTRRTFGVALAQGRPADPSQLAPSRAFTSFEFSHEGKKLIAWDVPGDAAQGPICVLTHGFGDSKLGGLSRVHALLPSCSRAVMWDMQGHGESEGTSTQGTHEVHALLTLIRMLPTDREIVLYGWSMGAGVSLVAAVLLQEERAKCEQASDVKAVSPRIKGLVLESPYRFAATPARNVLQTVGFPTGVLLSIALALIPARTRVGGLSLKPAAFDRGAWAARLGKQVPVLVLHGAADHVSPIADGEAIAHACGGKLVTLAEGGHFGLWTDDRWRQTCERVVDEWMNSSPVKL